MSGIGSPSTARGGETSLSVMTETTARRHAGLVCLKGEVSVYAARAIAPHLAGRKITLDARKLFGVRFFASDLPKDFGLRSTSAACPRGTGRSPRKPGIPAAVALVS